MCGRNRLYPFETVYHILCDAKISYMYNILLCLRIQRTRVCKIGANDFLSRREYRQFFWLANTTDSINRHLPVRGFSSWIASPPLFPHPEKVIVGTVETTRFSNLLMLFGILCHFVKYSLCEFVSFISSSLQNKIEIQIHETTCKTTPQNECGIGGQWCKFTGVSTKYEVETIFAI